MRLADFEAMVRRMTDEIPPHFLDGVAEIVVSPRTVPHPVRGEIYTLGECIPLWPDEAEGGLLRSRIVLYHGSFAALARRREDFDWRQEAWETLTHELRHHLEWRARAPDLEALDRAAEENFARQDGDPFDPAFYLDGESPAPGVFQVEDDYFLDRVVRRVPREVELEWHGRRYRVVPPPDTTLPAFLTVEGVEEPPPGELVLVLRRKPGVRDLFRRPVVYQGTVPAEPPTGPSERGRRPAIFPPRGTKE
ncbi:MAG TPA: metallopeptidase family protein [Gemmatimonadales bacterium]|nr:metallopeptidase family protein [Gemmatimonadales bacterium]